MNEEEDNNQLGKFIGAVIGIMFLVDIFAVILTEIFK